MGQNIDMEIVSNFCIENLLEVLKFYLNLFKVLLSENRNVVTK